MNLNILFFTIILSIFLHFFIQKLFIKYNRFDDFNHRSSHKTLATRTGGIGLFLTLFLISLFYYFNKSVLFDYSLFIPLGIMFLIGVYDDIYYADFKLKFFLQIIVAKILINQGYVITNYHGLFGLFEIPWILAQLSTIFVFLVVVNAINFIDGIDGLAVTETIKIILIIEFFSESYTSLAPIGFLVITSILPLYYFNFKNENKVFLGDGGSMFMGTIIMIYGLYTISENYFFKPEITINKTLFLILVLLYPLADLFRVFLKRILKRKSPFVADKSHLHHIINEKLNSHLFSTLLIQFIHLLIFTIFFLIIN